MQLLVLVAFILLNLLGASAIASQRQIAFTFDDAPRNASAFFNGPRRAERLIAELKGERVPPVFFFCNTSRFDAEGIKRVRNYASAGHLIANHTHGHKDLHIVGANEFVQDIKLADNALRGFPNFVSWFRFPFLHEGSKVEERDEVRRRLVTIGYKQGYVTVDNYDWYMDKLFQEALRAKKKIHFDRLRQAYIQILAAGIEFYDNIAVKTLGRSPKHVMLLHENDLAALYAGDLARHLRSKGWDIISAENAYTDPISNLEPITLQLGQGRVAAIAVDRGYEGSIVSDWDSEAGIENEFTRRRVWESN